MRNLKEWFADPESTEITGLVIICVTVLLITALILGGDLSWVPGLLRDLLLSE